MTSAMSCPCDIKTSACRSFATISSGLCFFFGISVLLHVKRHSSGRTTFQGEDHREAQPRYAASPKGREAKRRYDASLKGREAKRRYNASPKGREAKWQYDTSPKGRERKRRYN